MKILKVVAILQAVLIVYLLKEQSIVAEQIVESANVVSKSTKKIEALASENYELDHAVQDCKFELNKYRQEVYPLPSSIQQ